MADFDEYFSHLDPQSEIPVDKICSNCSSPFHPPPDFHDSQRDCEILSSIYKLNLTSTSNQNTHKNSPLILCPFCREILHELFSLFSKFNQIRHLESQLHREIQNVDKILNNSQNQNKSPMKLKHSSFSCGPWVQIGRRLEEMEFDQIGYKPKTRSSSRLSTSTVFQPPQKHQKQQEEKQKEESASLSKNQEKETNLNKNDEIDADLNESNENEDFCDDFVPEEIQSEDVKLFSESVTFEQDDFDSPSENPVKRKRGRQKRDSATPKTKGRPKKTEKRLKPRKPSKKSRMENRIAEKKLAQIQNPPRSENPHENSSEVPNPPKTTTTTKPKRRRRKKDDPPGVVGRPPSKFQKFSPAELADYYKCLGEYNPPILDRLAAEEEEIHKHKCVASGCSTTQEFKSAKALEKHEKTVHKNEAGPFVCNLNKTKGGKVVCKFEAKSLDQLRRHRGTGIHQLLKDNNRVTCLKCGISLQSQTSYRTHFYKTHTEFGKKWYQQTANKANERARVKRAEENAEGFICKICNVDFLTRMRLTSHRISDHEDYGSRYKPHVCEICGKTLLGQYRLNLHVTTVHAVDRPFVCDSCGKTYKVHSNLQDHLKRSHTDEGRLRWNRYIQENGKRRKIIQEALKRKNQQIQSQEQQMETQETTTENNAHDASHFANSLQSFNNVQEETRG